MTVPTTDTPASDSRRAPLARVGAALLVAVASLVSFALIGGIIAGLTASSHNYGAPAGGGLVGLALGALFCTVAIARFVRRRPAVLVWIGLALLALASATLGLLWLATRLGWARW